MKLKEYQEKTLTEVKRYLEQLVVWRGNCATATNGYLILQRRHGRSPEREACISRERMALGAPSPCSA